MKKEIIIAIFSLAALAACKKHIINEDNFPEIGGVTTDACAGTVTITGKGFGTNAANDSVFFGDIKAPIISVTPNKLVAGLPPVNVSGPVTVYSNGSLFTSGDTVKQYAPVITSIAPALAGAGAKLTITGSGFNPDIKADSVFFGDKAAVIVSVTAVQVTVIVPDGAATGAITFRSNCRFAASPVGFTFSNKGVVYIGSNGGNFYAIDIASGAVNWTFAMGGNSSASPAYDSGMVFIGSGYDNNLYALDAKTGTKIWDCEKGPWSGTPLVDNGVLYTGSFDNNIYALDEKTGTPNWTFKAKGLFRFGLTLYNGALYAAEDAGNFYCLDAQAGTLKWKIPIAPSGNPSVVNGTVYTAGFDSAGENSYLYALDAATGETKWRFFIPSLSGSAPTVSNGVVYIGSGDHNMYAVNAHTGQEIWRTELSWWISSAAIADNNLVYIAVGDGALYALDAASGTITWGIPLAPNGFYTSSPTLANGVLYMGDDGGNVHAVDAATGQPIWVVPTSGYPVLSNACVVDANGKIFYSGDSGKKQ